MSGSSRARPGAPPAPTLDEPPGLPVVCLPAPPAPDGDESIEPPSQAEAELRIPGPSTFPSAETSRIPTMCTSPSTTRASGAVPVTFTVPASIKVFIQKTRMPLLAIALGIDVPVPPSTTAPVSVLISDAPENIRRAHREPCRGKTPARCSGRHQRTSRRRSRSPTDNASDARLCPQRNIPRIRSSRRRTRSCWQRKTVRHPCRHRREGSTSARPRNTHRTRR